MTAVPRILVVTGASGTGKTATVRALDALAVPGIQCFHFDSIDVPTPDVMERDFDGGEQWQASATAEWLAQLSSLPADAGLAVLDAQTRPSFVFSAAPRAAAFSSAGRWRHSWRQMARRHRAIAGVAAELPLVARGQLW